MECAFTVDIYAPKGLAGIEPHLVHCELGLVPYRSGYNGKVILRAPPDSDLEWEMDSSDHPAMFASGFIPGEPRAAEAKLRTLSTALRLAGFPHRILLDDPSGKLAASIEQAWSAVTDARPKYDQDFWEQLWSKTLREHADKVAHRPPNAHLMTEAAALPPGRALDAGCGHGADTLWLAAHGWEVTAVDFSAAALAHGRAMAEAAGAEVAGRIDWIESDLATWTAAPGHYDLVVCLYVHVAGSMKDMVRRLANAVALAGTLFMVGHRPIDPLTGAATAAAGQVQVSLEDALAVLDAKTWELVVAEERPRTVAGTGFDAVIRARRRA